MLILLGWVKNGVWNVIALGVGLLIGARLVHTLVGGLCPVIPGHALESFLTLLHVQLLGQDVRLDYALGRNGLLYQFVLIDPVLPIQSIKIENLLLENINRYKCYIANDNSVGQIVVSGEIKDLDLMSEDLKKDSIKNIKLPVSAPFHCPLMSKATEEMKEEINKTEFHESNCNIISNVTGTEVKDISQIKDLLIKQIESPVRWRESVLYMKAKGVNKIVEIGPGKVLSGLIKRIDRNLISLSINTNDEIKNIKLNDWF